MTDCSFCGNTMDRGTGLLYVKKDGTVFNFCSSKCRHNLVDLRRINRHTKWTKAFAKGGN